MYTFNLYLFRQTMWPSFRVVKYKGKPFSYILLTVLPNILKVFFTNLMHKFFVLIHLLYSLTCFEHYCAHLQEDKLY